MQSTHPAEPAESEETSRGETGQRDRSASGDRSRRRAQTEPLAALVAVAAVCLAVSLYSGFLTSLVTDQGSDREVGDATVERIWHHVSADGVFDATQTDLQTDFDEGILPRGHSVTLSITYVGEEGYLESAGTAAFGPDGTELDDAGPPQGAERFERPVPVKLGPGDVRPGTFEVVVWG